MSFYIVLSVEFLHFDFGFRVIGVIVFFRRPIQDLLEEDVNNDFDSAHDTFLCVCVLVHILNTIKTNLHTVDFDTPCILAIPWYWEPFPSQYRHIKSCSRGDSAWLLFVSCYNDGQIFDSTKSTCTARWSSYIHIDISDKKRGLQKIQRDCSICKKCKCFALAVHTYVCVSLPWTSSMH